MTYYYAVYNDDYQGFYDQHRSSSMKNALIGLRKLLSEHRAEVGFVSVKQLYGTPMSRNPTGFLGRMIMRSGKRKIAISFNGRKIQTFADDYIWYGKGKRKGMLVMSDGSLRKME